MDEQRRIPCPECDEAGMVCNEIGHAIACPMCGGGCTIPDRRSPTANDRAVERIKAYAERTSECNTDPCSVILRIINEEAERGQ